MKAYDITELTAELESSDSVRYIHKYITLFKFVGHTHGRGYRKQIHRPTVKVICSTRIVGRRQVTVWFMN